MKISRVAAALGLSACLASATAADSTLFNFGQTNVTVRAEDGFCSLDTNQAFDKAWMDVQIKANAGSNEVAGAYMLCEDLAQLRNGMAINLDRWIILLAPVQGQAKASPVPGVTRQQLIDAMANEFEKGVQLDLNEINQSLRSATHEVLGTEDLPPIEISGSSSPILLAKTDNGVFGALQMQATSEEGTVQVAAVMGITLVNSHMLSVNVYRMVDTPRTFNMLLGEASAMVDEIVARNN